MCPPSLRRRTWRTLLALWVLSQLPVLALAAEAEGKAVAAAGPEAPRHALVIGNSRYASLSLLPNVANDLSDMCDALKRLRFRTTCLSDIATREQFLAATESFVGSVPAGASALLYYGGHAVQVAGENYLIPTRAGQADPRGWLPQFVRLSEIFQIAERRRAGFRFIVLDACREDPDAASPAPGAPVAKSGSEQLRALMHSVRSGGRFATYGIAAVRDAPPDTLVLFGTAAGSVAFDGAAGERNGALTKQLLLQIQRPRQHIDQVVKNVIQAVGDETERRYRRRQSPALYGTFTGDFCFDGCPRQGEDGRPREDERGQEEAGRKASEESRRQSERLRRESVVVPAL